MEKLQWHNSPDYHRCIPDDNYMLTVSRMMNTKMWSEIIWHNGQKVHQKETFNAEQSMRNLESIYKNRS